MAARKSKQTSRLGPIGQNGVSDPKLVWSDIDANMGKLKAPPADDYLRVLYVEERTAWDDTEAALDMALNVGSEVRRALSLVAIARRLIAGGDLADAGVLLDDVNADREELRTSIRVRCALALAWHSAGNRERAVAVAEAARKLLPLCGDLETYEPGYLESALRDTGQLIETLLELAIDPETEVLIALKVARFARSELDGAAAALYRFERAADALALVGRSRHSTIAETLIDAATNPCNVDFIKQVLERVQDRAVRFQVWLHAARAVFAGGHPEAARDIILELATFSLLRSQYVVLAFELGFRDIAFPWLEARRAELVRAGKADAPGLAGLEPELLVRVFAELGDVEGTELAVRCISEDWYATRIAAYCDAARLLREKHPEHAAHLLAQARAERTNATWDFAACDIPIIRHTAETSGLAAAIPLFEAALSEASQRRIPHDRKVHAMLVLEAWINAGDLLGPLASLKSVRAPGARLDALERITMKYAASGDLNGSLGVLQSMPKGSNRALVGLRALAAYRTRGVEPGK